VTRCIIVLSLPRASARQESDKELESEVATPCIQRPSQAVGTGDQPYVVYHCNAFYHILLLHCQTLAAIFLRLWHDFEGEVHVWYALVDAARANNVDVTTDVFLDVVLSKTTAYFH
jgi:hypothetical protein